MGDETWLPSGDGALSQVQEGMEEGSRGGGRQAACTPQPEAALAECMAEKMTMSVRWHDVISAGEGVASEMKGF